MVSMNGGAPLSCCANAIMASQCGGMERLTFSLYTFEGQKMAPRERASISAAVTRIKTLFSGYTVRCERGLLLLR